MVVFAWASNKMLPLDVEAGISTEPPESPAPTTPPSCPSLGGSCSPYSCSQGAELPGGDTWCEDQGGGDYCCKKSPTATPTPVPTQPTKPGASATPTQPLAAGGSCPSGWIPNNGNWCTSKKDCMKVIDCNSCKELGQHCGGNKTCRLKTESGKDYCLYGDPNNNPNPDIRCYTCADPNPLPEHDWSINEWLKEVANGQYNTKGNWKADVNGDGYVNLLDFEMIRRGKR